LGGGGCQQAPSKIEILKTDFVGTVIQNTVCDLPFSHH